MERSSSRMSEHARQHLLQCVSLLRMCGGVELPDIFSNVENADIVSKIFWSLKSRKEGGGGVGT